MNGARLSPRRRAILGAMGIDVWRLRTEEPADAAAAARQPEPAPPLSEPAGTAALVAEPEPVEPPPAPATAAPANAALATDWHTLNQQIRGCERCSLHQTRTQAVCGVGAESADWLIVGEAPGADEDAKGEPFVGRAGQLLNEMLRALGLAREQVYIANVLKCRPPGNRNPSAAEIAECRPYLDRQIELLQPKIILVVGAIAARTLLNVDPKVAIARLRGTVHEYSTAAAPAGAAIPLVVTYHPAYLLRKPVEKRKSWEDLRLARATLEVAGAGS